ncbi:NUDIX domain-containing protein [Streptomyces sp. NPDC056549]|uniref:NUDIX domain-containing protein n=1 Tax=Streptomyces sp. NPDC056549 TaxID=3345864 RepID=UPI00369E0730
MKQQERVILPHKEWLATLVRAYAGTSVLVTDTEGRVLIVKPTYRDGWQFPGGVVDKDESPDECAHRELLEETGLDLPMRGIVAVTWSPPGKRLDLPAINLVFDAGAVPAGTEVTLQEDELEAYEWAAPEEADTLLLPSAASRMHAALAARTSGIVPFLPSGNDC